MFDHGLRLPALAEILEQSYEGSRAKGVVTGRYSVTFQEWRRVRALVVCLEARTAPAAQPPETVEPSLLEDRTAGTLGKRLGQPTILWRDRINAEVVGLVMRGALVESNAPRRAALPRPTSYTRLSVAVA